MEKSDDTVAFYKLLFDEELYLIPENKGYQPLLAVSQNVVSEEQATYNALLSPFDGITSKTLIMFNYPNDGNIPSEDQAFLEQVLRAVRLSFNTVSRLNTAGLPENMTWEEIAAQSASDYVIGFGVDKKYLPAGIDEGQIYNMNGKRALCSATLSELSANNNRKKLLWQGLKEIYGI